MTMRVTISTADYVVLSATALLSVITGLFYAFKESRHQGSGFRYHLGAGKMKALPVALSLLVTFESSIFFLGYPAEVYVHGVLFWLSNVGMFIGFSNLLWVSVPLFHPLRITSVYEYLEMRYGAADVRKFASLLSSLSMVLYAGVVLFGAGTALESVSDIPAWAFVMGMSAVAVLYTALGGLKAVVATDVIQGIIMMTAIFAVIIKGTMEVGGVGNVISLNRQSGRMKLVDFDPNPMVRHTFWTLVVGGGIRSLAFLFKQPTVQRLNCTSSQTEAKKVVLIAVPMFVILQVIVIYEGLVAFAYFSNKGCDPLASGAISNPNQIISYTVLDMFQTTYGLPGLFLGALCSASLSTISSLLSSISAVVSEDIVKHYMVGVIDVRLTQISKVIVLLTGIVCCGIAILIGQVSGPLTQISVSIIGSVDAPLTALFLMTVFVGFATRKGVMTGAIFGLAFGGWLSGGYNFTKGRKVTPWLPLGPTDGCPDMNMMSLMFNGSTQANTSYALEMSRMSSTFDNVSTDTSMSIQHTTEVLDVLQKEETIVTGIDHLYSISYIYFPTLIIALTILIGLFVSKLTQPKTPDPVPDHLILSFRDQFLCCFKKRYKSIKKSDIIDLCE